MSVKTFYQKKYLFTDLRHIRCGDLEWFSPEGDYLPTTNPPLPVSEARAQTGFVPYGIRLEAKEASREVIPTKTYTGQIIFEDGLYRSWYIEPPAHSTYKIPGGPAICYIESSDGFEWTEPRKSPLEVPAGDLCHELSYFIDPNGSEEERYKCVYPVWAPPSEMPSLWEEYQKIHPRYREARFNKNRIQRMYGAVSPDGINWTSLPQPLMYNFGDTDTTVYYDKFLGKYVMYTRKYIHERRWIGRAESDDFRNWGPIESIIWPSLDWPYSQDIYTNGRCYYPGSEDYHLMFPWIYQRYTQSGGVWLYSSEDGICWNKIPGGSIIPYGQTGDWDGEHIGAMHNLVPFGKDRVAIKSVESGRPHKFPRWEGTDYGGGMCWSSWQEGRLSGLVADEDGGFFTFPTVPQGRQLRLNARVHRGGDLRVGFMVAGSADVSDHIDYSYHNRQDVAGHTVDDCDPVFGNDLSIPVHWNGQTDIGIEDGVAVTIQFKLRAAELFGFEWV